MPSAEETTTTTSLFKVIPETTQDFVTRDVDHLVSEIKENLRLSSLKAKSSVKTKNRASPYLPLSRNEQKMNLYEIRMKHINNKNKTEDDDDPYEQLCQLIKQGRLINEAVKKLQIKKLSNLSNSDDCGYRKKTYYYDSEDEQLPAVYGSLDL
ncbi:uncharacterized protein LOC122860224 [Aphidius gifuensis]|uniref:uncharacterized protein LOC122860224 n=1 Tax=Aphidius gifuensis TaxID=684658 RepID=UPI001CDD40D8|nr:uncharacterized protein LOC122860224 [Aphidius gifuensis]